MAKPEQELYNNLKQTRLRLGMSQQDLATLGGVSRQTIGGIESRQYAPSTAVALRLAKALGCQVEDLFWIEEDNPVIEAIPVDNPPLGQKLRLSLAKVGQHWMAYPLLANHAFRQEMIPADAEGIYTGETSTMKVRLLKDLSQLHHTIALAGCSPAISLWAKSAELWHPKLRVHWTFDNSMNALHRLRRGEVHLAGVHLYDEETQKHNLPFVKAVLDSIPLVVINLGSWEEGLLIKPGNPHGLTSIADLLQSGVKIVNREKGSGSRQVLERQLRQANIEFSLVEGFNNIVYGHLQVAEAVASGKATTGVSIAAVAEAFGLDFISLHRSRYDLVLFKSYLDEAPIQQLLNTLGHRGVLSQLEALGGYDTSQTGEVMGTFN